MIRRWAVALTAALLLLESLATAVGQPSRRNGPPPRGTPAFGVDVASFPGEGRNSRVEVFVSIPLGELSAEGPESLFGPVSILAIFYNSDGDQITGDEWSYHNIPLGAPVEARGRYLNRRYTFELPAGKIEAKVRVNDLIRGGANEKRLKFEVPDFSRLPIRLSGPVFGLCRDAVAQAPEGTTYGPVLPFPSRRYGNGVPGVCVYYELSDVAEVDGPYEVHYKLKSSFGRTWQDTVYTQPRTRGEVTGLLVQPRHRDLPTGSYELELEVRLGKEKARRKSTFSMDETRMTFQENPDKLRTIMGYVATNEEKTRLESLPNDSLSVYWRAFWQRRDPDPETPSNEALARFLERVDYAAEEFGVLEPGWKSDRGRIYIKFGPPDQVEEFYTETYRYPTLVWYYYSRNRNFVFQDQEGFGRYRLVGMQEE